VAIFTSHVTNSADVPLRVFITLYGEHGDSGRRPLTKSKTHATPFVADQVDVFYIPVGNLGKPHRVVIELIADKQGENFVFIQ
jgi:hypothetical protein